MTQKITVHDPRGYPPKVVGKRLASRLSSLDGKTVYLVDCLFDNSAVFMDQLQQWFGEHLPAGSPRPSKRDAFPRSPYIRSDSRASAKRRR